MGRVGSIQRARERREEKSAQKGEITTTLGVLLDSGPALKILTTASLPASQAFALAKITRAVDEEIEAGHGVRVKLCEQYGKLDKTGVFFEFEGDKKAAFEAEWLALAGSPVSIKGSPIKIADIQGVSISAAALQTLSWLVVE